MRLTSLLLLFGAFLFSVALNGSEPDDETGKVVPRHEHTAALQKGLDGPRKSRGISSVVRIGEIDLGDEFPTMVGRQMRARIITVAPGGMVAVHEHDQRPGIAFILEGEIVEHRNDVEAPQLRKAGDAAFEKSGVAHWWENRSTSPVKALVVDIIGPAN